MNRRRVIERQIENKNGEHIETVDVIYYSAEKLVLSAKGSENSLLTDEMN